MSARFMHLQPFPAPPGASQATSSVPVGAVSHIPGQAAAIRFFDPQSLEDYQAMKETLQGKHVRKWMDEPTISREEYQDWAGTHTNESFLFAVLDARMTHLQDFLNVRGFIYIYSERAEKFRVKRMEKAGFLEPTRQERYALEVSFAMRPLREGMHSGSGLMSSALRQSCWQVRKILQEENKPEVTIFAFVDQENVPAQRTLESAGFVSKGLMKYDADSEDETCVYILSWRLLQKKIKERFMS